MLKLGNFFVISMIPHMSYLPSIHRDTTCYFIIHHNLLEVCATILDRMVVKCYFNPGLSFPVFLSVCIIWKKGIAQFAFSICYGFWIKKMSNKKCTLCIMDKFIQGYWQHNGKMFPVKKTSPVENKRLFTLPDRLNRNLDNVIIQTAANKSSDSQVYGCLVVLLTHLCSTNSPTHSTSLITTICFISWSFTIVHSCWWRETPIHVFLSCGG